MTLANASSTTTSLGPKGLATRAQVAQVLTNFLDVQKEVVKRNLDIQN